MKKIILTLLIMTGFFITASAQRLQNRPVGPADRKFDRMELRRIHRMERRRRHRHRIASEINPTNMQRSQAVLDKAGENTTI